jgi:hypothetical protein
VFLIDHALSPTECSNIIEAAEKAGFEQAGIDPRASRSKEEGDMSVIRTDIRLNERIMLDSPRASDVLFKRLSPMFPQEFRDMKIDSFADKLRLYKYGPGQYFKPHVDGEFFDRIHGTRSVFTVLLYLNNVKDGGRTLFYSAKYNNYCVHDRWFFKTKTNEALVIFALISEMGWHQT